MAEARPALPPRPLAPLADSHGSGVAEMGSTLCGLSPLLRNRAAVRPRSREERDA